MSARAAKAKGRRLQNYVRDELRSMYPDLHEDDIKSQTMGMSGEDIVLSPAAKARINYSFECKNKERLDLWKSLEQTSGNSEDRDPVLIIKRNKTKVYAIIEWVTFRKLLEAQDGKEA